VQPLIINEVERMHRGASLRFAVFCNTLLFYETTYPFHGKIVKCTDISAWP